MRCIQHMLHCWWFGALAIGSASTLLLESIVFLCEWRYRLVSGPGSPHKYDAPLHC